MSTAIEVRSPRCAVCRHPQVQQIESALFDRELRTSICARFKVKESALRRHVRRHLPAALEEGFNAREFTRVRNLVQRVEILHVEAIDILAASRNAGIRDRVAVVNTVLGVYELLGRLTGKLVGNGVNELFARLGVRDEDQLRQMLQVARANVSMSTEDHILNGAEIVRAALPDKPEMIDEVRRILEPVLKKALPTNTNGHTNGGEH